MFNTSVKSYFSRLKTRWVSSSNEDIKVSIVVPIFNKESYLVDTLTSIIRQSHKNIEIILVNDGSTDNSGKIIEEFSRSDSRIVIVAQENQGLSVARNAGLKIVTGTYVLFFDADDILLESSVSNLLNIAIIDKADITVGLHEKNIIRDHNNHKNINRRIRKKVKEQWKIWNRNVNMGSRPDLVPLYRSHISACNKLFKHRFLLDKKLEFVPGLYMQDLEFWLRVIFLAKSISFTPYIIAEYWVRNEGASQQRSLKRFSSVFKIFQNLDMFYQEKNLSKHLKHRDEAILSAAVFFFMKWFLEELDNQELMSPRRELSLLLRGMPNAHLDSFFKETIGPVLLAFRDEQYEEAAAIMFDGSGEVQKKLIKMDLSNDADTAAIQLKNTFGLTLA